MAVFGGRNRTPCTTGRLPTSTSGTSERESPGMNIAALNDEAGAGESYRLEYELRIRSTSERAYA
jgi:hypothetical protein